MKGKGATLTTVGPGARLGAWMAHHRLVFITTLRGLLANPVGSLMTWLVIGIALALPAILYLILQNISALTSDWGGEPRVSLFLIQDMADEEGRQLAQEIGRHVAVERTRFISSGEALVEFQQKSGLGDVLQTLDRNPLPGMIEVIPKNPDAATLLQLVETWQAHKSVERVSVDLQWLERLFALLAVGRRLVSALGLVLGAGVVLVMGNTIRLVILNRRAEIEIVRLFGGTNAFVRRPFLYLGFWYGLGGALLALILIQGSMIFLATPVELITRTYQDAFVLQGLSLTDGLLLCIAGMALGVLGAVLAVGRHLSAIKPA